MTEIRVAIIGGGGFMGTAHSLGWALAPIAGDAGATIRKAVLVEATEERAIVDGRPGSPSFAEATRTQRVIAAVMQSADTHQWVTVDEVTA
ncbi:hypothetical protein H7H51_23460 [Mycolicibacterium farcinogenes]|nr:hypothetical protein [Mycolicibacterium farcinogenes]